MDAITIAAWTASITATVVAVITVIATKGIDGWIKLRTDNRIDDTRTELAVNAVLLSTIERQDKRIDKLETELRSVHEKHNDCERKYVALITRLDLMDASVKSSLQETKSALRQVVNDVKDSQIGVNPQPVNPNRQVG